MARRSPRPEASRHVVLRPMLERCEDCGGALWVAHHKRRTVTTLQGVYDLRLVVRQCPNSQCQQYHRRYRPEEEARWALPHGEFGLDVIALVGALRFREHRSVPEIHQELLRRGVQIAERSVTHLIERYEELVTVHVADRERIQEKLKKQGRVILAIDGLQPDAAHEVLWVIRDCLSQEILLARPLLSSAQEDVATLLREVKELLAAVPIKGVISDGQKAIRAAVRVVFPKIPHQLCQLHYLKDAAKPIVQADRHAATQLKAQVRGIRPIERALEARTDEAAETARDYCLAVRSAITDDGHPPLKLGGIKLHTRLSQIRDSLDLVAQKRGLGLACKSCDPS
jgi:MULE transposase domain